ncbi:hypothetical protein [Kitasatospora sp. NPDC056531]|uniref:hypothetical protein n=1 Tax=Kitasatospora sp. NPDC056531 TaxID=3345856 RepID=UPI0036BABCE2
MRHPRELRLLSEGIGIAAVGAVVFADPKSSVIDIVQAVGRALRQSHWQGKVSWVVIPAYLLLRSATTSPPPTRLRSATRARW